MNYRTQGHKHRLQIISPPVGANRRCKGLLEFHCHACGTTYQIIRSLKDRNRYFIFNTF